MTYEHSCNLCGGADFKLVKPKLRDDSTCYKVYACLSCGHVQLNPKPTEDDDREFYDKNLQDKGRGKEIDYQVLLENNAFDTERHVELVESLASDRESRILDIGSGYGFFINRLAQKGYANVLGIEISDERRVLALEHGRARSIDYDLSDPANSLGQFDVITLFHVLEHLADPVAFLKRLRSFLKPTALFVCEVPNAKELLLENCEAYNDFYWIRAHLNYFSDSTLAACLEKSGFTDFRLNFVQRYGLENLCHWLATGGPQIEKPTFQIGAGYSWIEEAYRDRLEQEGRSDALMALCRMEEVE